LAVWTPAEVADFGRRLYDKSAKDDVLFLAGGVAYNILLAGVPFFLLLASGIGYALGATEADASRAVTSFVLDFFPSAFNGGTFLDPVIRDVVRTRSTAGVIGAIAFVWFSTRFFGALRTVLDTAMDVPKRHGIFFGKLFDVWLTVAAAGLVTAWIGMSAYFVLARTRGVALLSEMGLHAESLMGPLTYWTGRLVTFVLLVTIFFGLYKVLPNRRVRREQALIGAVSAALLFELARQLFAWAVSAWNPASLYSGTLATVVVVVFWVYYAALIVIIGAEASQVHEGLREARLKAK